MVTINLENPIIMGTPINVDADTFTIDEWHTFMTLLKKLPDATLNLKRCIYVTENE